MKQNVYLDQHILRIQCAMFSFLQAHDIVNYIHDIGEFGFKEHEQVTQVCNHYKYLKSISAIGFSA